MADITFDESTFRANVPTFADDVKYPVADIETNWDIAIEFISASDYGYLSGSRRVLAINLFAAHLYALELIYATNGTGGTVQSGSEGSVSVSFLILQPKNQFHAYCQETPYGKRFYALLEIAAVGGLMFGGENRPVRGRDGRY